MSSLHHCKHCGVAFVNLECLLCGDKFSHDEPETSATVVQGSPSVHVLTAGRIIEFFGYGINYDNLFASLSSIVNSLSSIYENVDEMFLLVPPVNASLSDQIEYFRRLIRLVSGGFWAANSLSESIQDFVNSFQSPQPVAQPNSSLDQSTQTPPAETEEKPEDENFSDLENAEKLALAIRGSASEEDNSMANITSSSSSNRSVASLKQNSRGAEQVSISAELASNGAEQGSISAELASTSGQGSLESPIEQKLHFVPLIIVGSIQVFYVVAKFVIKIRSR